MAEFIQQFKNEGRLIFQGLKAVPKIRLSLLGKVFSLMGKHEKYALFFLIFIFFIGLGFSLRKSYFAHTNPIPARGGKITEAVRGQPVFLNPILAYQEPDLSLTRLLFASLYKYDENGKLVPELADGMPEISQDQKQYIIKLKTGRKWHDGRPIDANDIIFTIKILQNPQVKSPYNTFWQSTTVEKLSETSVKFITKDISGPFLGNLTLPILPEYVWMKVDAQNFPLSEFNLKAIGSGAFAISEISKLPNGKIQSLNLKAFDGYTNGRPYLDEMTIKFFDTDEQAIASVQAKEADFFSYLTSNTKILAERTGNLQIFSAPSAQYQTLFFNLRKNPLSESSIRQAVNLAIDRKQIISQAFGEQNILGFKQLIFNFGEQSLLNPEFSKDKAIAQLEAAGWALNAETLVRERKKIGLNFVLATNEYEPNVKAAKLISQNLKEVGINADVKTFSNKQLSEEIIKGRNFDLLLFFQKFSPDPDPFIFWHSSQKSDPGLNLSGLNSQAADKLIVEARTTTDQNLRLDKYRLLEQTVSQELASLPINQAQYFFVANKNLKGVAFKSIFEPAQRYSAVSRWYVQEKRAWK